MRRHHFRLILIRKETIRDKGAKPVAALRMELVEVHRLRLHFAPAVFLHALEAVNVDVTILVVDVEAAKFVQMLDVLQVVTSILGIPVGYVASASLLLMGAISGGVTWRAANETQPL